MGRISKVIRLIASYVSNVMVGIDQIINTLFFGEPDETISSRAGKARELGSYKWTLVAEFVDVICWMFERDHCRKSMERDRIKRLYHL